MKFKSRYTQRRRLFALCRAPLRGVLGKKKKKTTHPRDLRSHDIYANVSISNDCAAPNLPEILRLPRARSCCVMYREESCSLIKQVCAAGLEVKRNADVHEGEGGGGGGRGIIGIREKIDDIRPCDLTQFFRHPLSTKFIGEIKPPRPFILSLLVNEGRRSAGGRPL